MKTVTVHEAEGRLGQLIEAVKAGERVLILDAGQEVAELVVPAQRRRSLEEMEAVLEGIRSRSSLGGLTIKELRDEGRLAGQAFLDRLDEIARGNRLEGVSILELRDEGRRQ